MSFHTVHPYNKRDVFHIFYFACFAFFTERNGVHRPRHNHQSSGMGQYENVSSFFFQHFKAPRLSSSLMVNTAEAAQLSTGALKNQCVCVCVVFFLTAWSQRTVWRVPFIYTNKEGHNREHGREYASRLHILQHCLLVGRMAHHKDNRTEQKSVVVYLGCAR